MTSFIKYIVLFVQFSIYLRDNEAKTSFKRVYFLSKDLTINPYYLTYYTLDISHNKLSMDVSFGFASDINHDIWFSISIALKTEGKRNMPIFEQEINACDMVKRISTKTRGFIMSWLRKFWTYNNFPHSCPVSQGNYSWIGINMDNLNIPTVIPRSRYAVNVFAYINKNNMRDRVANTSLALEIR